MDRGVDDKGRPPRRRLTAMVCAAADLLAACAAAPSPTYDLGAIKGGLSARQGGRRTLVVYEPTALAPVNSNRIVVRMGSDQIAYLSDAKWSDQLPALVQTRLIASFQDARIFRAVVGPDMLADYALRTNIRRFEFDPARGAAIVEIAVQLAGPSGRIVAEKVFSGSEPAPSDDGATVTGALNTALAIVIRQVALWTAPQTLTGARV